MATTPELHAPADGAAARLQSLVFSWAAIDGGADYYVLQIAADALFTNILIRIETTLTQAEALFDPGAIYYWRVQSHAGVTVATSTQVRYFSAPPFLPAAVDTHVEDGIARLLNQFLEGS